MPSSLAASRSTASVPMPQTVIILSRDNCWSTSRGHLTAPRLLIRQMASAARRTFSSAVAGRSVWRTTRPWGFNRSRWCDPDTCAGSSPGITITTSESIALFAVLHALEDEDDVGRVLRVEVLRPFAFRGAAGRYANSKLVSLQFVHSVLLFSFLFAAFVQVLQLLRALLRVDGHGELK